MNISNREVEKEVLSFNISRYSILDNEGNIKCKLPTTVFDTQHILKAY